MKEQLAKWMRGMASARWLTVLGLAAGIAGFAFARQYLATADRAIAARYASSYAPRRVLVAGRELASGASVSANLLAVRSMPQRYLPSGAVPVEEIDSVLSATLRVPLKPGDPIERGLLHLPAPSLATQLPSGSRGLSLGCEALGSLGAMLQAGDRLDVWLADDSGGIAGPDRAHAVTDVLVVATSAGASSDLDLNAGSGACSLTLRVTPAQAGQFLAAIAAGGIAAVLRPSREAPSNELARAIAESPVRRLATRHAAWNSLELLAADGHEISRRWLAAEIAP